MYSKCYYSISVLRNKPQSVTFQRRPTPCISSKWLKNSMQFTLGMPFLGVLRKFYRNLKGLRPRCGGVFTQSQTSCLSHHRLYTYAFHQAWSDGGTSMLLCHCGCPASNWPCGWDTYTHRQPISTRPCLHKTYEHRPAKKKTTVTDI